MPVIHIKVDGDDAWSDLREWVENDDPRLIQAMGNDTSWQMTLLEGGMQSGDYSVGIRLDLPDGRVVVAETSWALLKTAHLALKAKVEPPGYGMNGGRFG